jgi:hypothetical protein
MCGQQLIQQEKTMPYAVKHQDKDLYISGTTSQSAVWHEYGLVDQPYARIYATKSGANSARAQWATVWAPNGEIGGQVVRDQHMYDLVEIVEVQF